MVIDFEKKLFLAASSELALLSEEREGGRLRGEGEGTAEKTEEGRPSARQAESGHFSIVHTATQPRWFALK